MATNRTLRIGMAAALLYGSLLAAAVAAPLQVPFDFSRDAIGLDATLDGRAVYVMLDTGVDPSVIETSLAETLGMKIDRSAGGEAAGYGEAQSARVFPVTLHGLAIASRKMAPLAALAADTRVLSEAYGRKVDVVLGYSFLRDKIVLIDYAKRTVTLLDRRAEAKPRVESCRRRWTLPMQTLGDDATPIIADFRFGSSAGPITVDTGSNGGIGLFERAFDLPGLRSALVEDGEVRHAGARGYENSKSYVLNVAVGFGPFSLPAGQIVKLTKSADPNDKRIANIGNQLFDSMKLKILLDYPGKQMRFYGSCE